MSCAERRAHHEQFLSPAGWLRGGGALAAAVEDDLGGRAAAAAAERSISQSSSPGYGLVRNGMGGCVTGRPLSLRHLSPTRRCERSAVSCVCSCRPVQKTENAKKLGPAGRGGESVVCAGKHNKRRAAKAHCLAMSPKPGGTSERQSAPRSGSTDPLRGGKVPALGQESHRKAPMSKLKLPATPGDKASKGGQASQRKSGPLGGLKIPSGSKADGGPSSQRGTNPFAAGSGSGSSRSTGSDGITLPKAESQLSNRARAAPKLKLRRRRTHWRLAG